MIVKCFPDGLTEETQKREWYDPYVSEEVKLVCETPQSITLEFLRVLKGFNKSYTKRKYEWWRAQQRKKDRGGG